MCVCVCVCVSSLFWTKTLTVKSVPSFIINTNFNDTSMA